MSFDLSQLRFTVETKQLDDAITKVGALATSVAALNKPLSKLGSESKSTASDIDTATKAVDTNTKSVKVNQSILERQEAILNKMSEGWSKGQSSILASAKASGIANAEMQKLESTLASQRKLLGNEPFDKSASGLISLTHGLGSAREGYRQMTKYQEEFLRLQKEGNGEELRLVALNKKETDSLYRDKQRMIEQYKLLKNASFDSSNTEMIDKQKNAYKDLVQNVKNLETTYKQVATAKRPLDDLRTIDSTKQRDKLNYLARATSVQLGDIGVSLAGGQNPLTVLLQQGDQMRAIFGDIGREGHNMQTVLNSAFTQIVTGFRDVAKNLGKVVLIAIKDTAMGFAEVAMSMTGMKAAINEAGLILDTFAYKMGLSSKASEALAANFKATANALITPLIATGVLGLVAMLVTLGIAYKNILATSHELSNALILNGAALAVTKKEAMLMSGAMASGAATSLDVAKVITEVAQAGNLGKDALISVTTAAIDMNRYLGVSTKDVVAQYSKLADDPVKALTEIGIATGRISADTVDHIRGLIEEGDKTTAVAEATKELSRVHAEMAQKAREDMTPLGKLWDDMKFSINLLIEGVYKFAQSGNVVATLTTVWQTFAATVNGVLRLMNDAYTISKAVALLKNTSTPVGDIMSQTSAELDQNLKTFREGKEAIYNPEVAQAKAREEAKARVVEQEKLYVEVVKDGITTRREASGVEIYALKVNRDQIKARAELEKMEDKYGTKSVLTATQRLKKISDAKAQIEEQLKKSGLSAEEVELKRKPLYANIEEQFRQKKKGAGGVAERDTLGAQQQQIENDRNEAVRSAKMAMDAINSEHKRGLVNDYDYSTQKANIEQKSLADSVKFYTAEIEIAKKKVNSKKEIETLEGKIKKAESDIKDKELEKGYAQLEYIQKLRDATIAEIQTLADKNKAQTLDNELIGLSAEKASELRIARLDSATALQAEHVAYLQRNGYAETSSAAYNLEVQKLREMTNARKLDTEALMKQTEAARKKLQEDSDSSFNKETFSMDSAQRDLDFRNSVIGTYGEQREEMKRAYELEKNLLEVNRKKTEELEAARKRYNALLTGNKEIDAGTKADLTKEEARIEGVGKRQEDLLRQGNKTAIKELEDAKLEKFSEGVADALVTGMTDGAKAGKKKLRDLIVAELTKTITLNITTSIKSLLTEGISKVGGSTLLNFLGGTAPKGEISSSSGDYRNGSDIQSDDISAAADSLGKLGEAAGIANIAIIAQTIATIKMGLAALAAAAQMAIAFVVANPVASFFIAVGVAIASIFSMGAKEAPNVLNDLDLFNQSLAGLPFQQIAYSSDEAAQGLRDVLYGLENATPTMRRLAGETIDLSIELMKASGDIAGARNLARNVDTRGMSKAEVALYDLNQGLKDQIEAANAGAAAAQAAAHAEEQLAKTRWDLAGKLNILLGRTTQKEFDRATELAGTTDAASLAMLKLIYQLEDFHAAVDASYARLERSIAAERKLAELRLQSATELASALKTTLETVIQPMVRQAAQAQIRMYSAAAKVGGGLPTAAVLKPALDSLAQPSIDLFGSFSEYMIDQARTANDISDLTGYADKQVDAEQLSLERLDAQLALAKSQLDALKGVDNSVVSVADAVLGFEASMLALANAQAAAPTYSYNPITGSGGGGGGGSSGGGAPAAQEFENIAGQDNKDIVAAYRAYYNRNPDEAGYQAFLKSQLSGDALMRAILGASAPNKDSVDYKTAVQKGYNPDDPMAKFVKSLLYPSSSTSGAGGAVEGAFAVGANYIPRDMTARIHKGEEITPRPYVDLQRAARDEANALMARLLSSNESLREEVINLRKTTEEGNKNTRKTADTLQGQQGVPFLVEIAQ